MHTSNINIFCKQIKAIYDTKKKGIKTKLTAKTCTKVYLSTRGTSYIQ